jgi:hypothetical protein
VYIKVSPMRGLHRFKVRGKLAPRFIGPFKILEKRGEVTYQLKLPPQLSDVHDVFHVSQLKKCLCVPEEQLPMEDLDAKEDLSYQEYYVMILKTSERVTRNKKIRMCKVQWSHHTEEEATWEREEELKAEFPRFFLIHPNLEDKIHFKGAGLQHPDFHKEIKLYEKSIRYIDNYVCCIHVIAYFIV